MDGTLVTLGLCLLMTIILEEGTALLLKVRSRLDIVTIFLCNTLTNPLLVLLNAALTDHAGIPSFVSLAVLESIAFVTEGLIYGKLLDYKKIRPMLLSFILNLVSFTLGSLIVWAILRVL